MNDLLCMHTVANVGRVEYIQIALEWGCQSC